MFRNKSFRVCAIAFAGVCVSQTAAFAQCGTASWYHEGAKTANGERYQPDGISAAHRSLPFGTKVLVKNQRTGRTVTVRINDRGPFIGGRIIDLSRGAKRVIGMDGLAPVCLTVLGRGERYVGGKETKAERVAVIRQAKPKRVAKAERRNVRVVRATYGTTQTSARYDDDPYNDRAASKPRNRSAKRAPRFEGQARQQQRVRPAAAFQVSGWPGTDSRF